MLTFLSRHMPNGIHAHDRIGNCNSSAKICLLSSFASPVPTPPGLNFLYALTSFIFTLAARILEKATVHASNKLSLNLQESRASPAAPHTPARYRPILPYLPFGVSQLLPATIKNPCEEPHTFSTRLTQQPGMAHGSRCRIDA